MSPTPSRRPRVLLVDDEEYLREAMRLGIQRGLPGVEVHEAADARDALDLLARHRIDVILSDQRMPGMSGVEFLVEARRIAPGADRMMMTAYPEKDLLERNVNEAQIRHFFTKPCRIAEVVETLRATFERRDSIARAQRDLAAALHGASTSDDTAPR